MIFKKGDKVKIGKRYKPFMNKDWNIPKFYPQPHIKHTITKVCGTKDKFHQFLSIEGYNGTFFGAYFIKA